MNSTATHEIDGTLVLLGTIGYITYWFVSESSWLRKYVTAPEKNDRKYHYLAARKLLGFLLLGVVPFMYSMVCGVNTAAVGVGPVSATKSSSVIIGCIVLLAIVAAWFAGKQEKTYFKHPEVRLPGWNIISVFKYCFFWMLYLLAYEFLFRGILFLYLIPNMGFYEALAINLALYSFAHLPKGLGESVGALVLGSLLCWVTYITGSFWMAFFIHFVFSGAVAIFSIVHNPQMRFGKR